MPGWHFLYADDDDDCVYFMQRALRGVGDQCRLTAARDGEEAAALLTACCPDVVILDVKMPRLDGFGALAWIRSQPPPLGTLPVVLFSSSDHPADIARARSLGATGYWVKPSQGGSLPDYVQSLLFRLTAGASRPGWRDFHVLGSAHKPSP